MYFMTSPATAMTMALEMMDQAARDSHQHRGRPVRAPRSARRSIRRARAEVTASAAQPERRGWRLARALHLA